MSKVIVLERRLCSNCLWVMAVDMNRDSAGEITVSYHCINPDCAEYKDDR